MGLTQAEAFTLKSEISKAFNRAAGIEGFGVGMARDGQGFAVSVYISQEPGPQLKGSMLAKAAQVLNRKVTPDVFNFQMTGPIVPQL